MKEKLIYDPDKLTVLDGFGLTQERLQSLILDYIHGSRSDVLSRICNDESLPPNEKYCLLIHVGVLLVSDTLYEMGSKLDERG